MKKLFSLALLLLIGATAGIAQNAKKGSYTGKGGTPHEVVTGPNVTISYGRPYKKGRDIFGGLEAYGKVWRLGADEATEITFEKGVVFGGKQVSAGTYTLFATPGKEEWTLIVNKALGQWGAYSYDASKDIVQVKVPVKHLDKVVEQLTITPKANELVIEWDKTSVTVPMSW